MQQARSAQAKANARLQTSEAEDDLSIIAEGRLRWVETSPSQGGDVIDDHKGSIFVRKPLYDFGRSGALQQAARSEAQAMVSHYQSTQDQQRVAIMQAFFNVLQADQENFRDNEAMAVAYVTLDRMKSHQELGQTSDIEVMEQESLYQNVRYQVLQSESNQRLTRSILANILNRPDELPSELVSPEFSHAQRKLPDYERLLQLAFEHNPRLMSLKLELDAALQRTTAAQNSKLPRLDGEIEASSYTRELGSSDSLRAGVTLSIPIYNGGRVDAAIATAEAEVMRLRGKLTESRHELRQALLEQWFSIRRLMIRRQREESTLAYRELYLDRSRANYEMEVKADLGDAMVRLSEAQLALLKVDFETALAWEHLRSLVGVEMDQLLAVDDTRIKEGSNGN